MPRLVKYVLFSVIFTLQGCQPYFKHLFQPLESVADTDQEQTYDVLTGIQQEQVYYLLKRTQQYSVLDKKQSTLACKELTLEYEKNPDWQIAWVLVYALNSDFSCVNLGDAIKLLKAIQAQQAGGMQLQWLTKAQIKVLEDIKEQYNKNSSLRSQLKASEGQLAMTQEQLGIAQDQLVELSSKIQALKAIESSINKKLDYEPSYKK
ncbi:MAG: hypothetical protein IBX55_14680 [Methyloprofundus sp.]|nr:hypothetical protein [Methyloprofundus sp.]